jgi:hypothetical protein
VGVGRYLDNQGAVAMYLSKNDIAMNKDAKPKLRDFIAYLRSKGDLPPANSSVSVPSIDDGSPAQPIKKTAVEYQKAVILPNAANEQSILPETQINRELLNQEIDSLMKRRGMSIDKGKAILMELYSVKGRSLLTDKQLLEFRDYLATSPAMATV